MSSMAAAVAIMDESKKEKYEAPVEEITEKMQRSFSIGEEDLEAYLKYNNAAKDAVRQGNLSEGLELFKSAYKIHSSEKLDIRIRKIEETLQAMAEEADAEDDFVDVNNCGLMLFKEMNDKLYDYQKEGVAFLYGLHKDEKKGGILADDMGLGKTIQIIAFLSGMYDSELVNHTLLVMPTSLLSNWAKEFAAWTPGMRVKEFHGSKAERDRNLQRVQRKGGVILTTYTMLLSNWELLASFNGGEFRWDYIILDEAHKIKSSSTKTTKSAHAIPAKHRILLTGTPVQNNLSELWALYNFAFQGALLGTAKTFKSEYENPITRARQSDATPGEKALGLKMSENLMTIINPYFLRRTKQDIQKKKNDDAAGRMNLENKENQNPNAEGLVMPTLTRKNDLIVWTYLSAVQEDIYRQFISLEHIKELLTTTRSPLSELNVLKKLCDHPRLLSNRAVAQLGLEGGINPGEQHDENESAACQIDHIPDETLVSESGKLTFLIELLGRLQKEGHRTLVFSQSRKMLDIVERVLTNKGFKLMRIDGTIINLSEREQRISLFQNDKRYTVFLLTTQVGGVGITLTAANRVVIFDPSWNPATDAQAVDRAYRIGQTENVVIYRLITCGTVEEKIYRRQVFKDSLIRQTTGDKKNPFRYFSQEQLRALFQLEDTRSSSTQIQLQSMHSRQRRTDPELDEHIAHLHSMEMFGISDHDLMFSHDDAAHEDHPEDQESQYYIENRVLKAHELMKAESELQQQLMENMVSNTEPSFLRNPGVGKRSNEGKPAKIKPSISPVSNGGYNEVSPAVVDLTRSSPEPDEPVLNLSNKLREFVLDCSTESKSPDQEQIKDEVCSNSFTSEKSLIEEHSYADVEVAGPSLQGDDERMTFALLEDNSVLSVHDPIDMEKPALPDHAERSCQSVDLQTTEALAIQDEAFSLDAKVDERMTFALLEDNSVLSVHNLIDMEKPALPANGERSCPSVDLQTTEALAIQDEAFSLDAKVDERMTSALLEDNSVLSVHNLIDMEKPALPANGERSCPSVDLQTTEALAIQEESFNLDTKMDECGPEVQFQTNSKLSALQASHISNDGYMEESVKSNCELDSFQGNFNLQLEDSAEEMFPEKENSNPVEENPSLQLDTEASIDVSATENGRAIGSEEDDSTESHSLINYGRKKTPKRIIYDSEDEEENCNDEDVQSKSSFNEPFKGLDCSTPKPFKTLSSTQLRKSIGLNVSVASRRSLAESMIDDVEDLVEDMDAEEAEQSGSMAESSGSLSESVMEEEEPSGETLNTEGEETRSESEFFHTGDAELCDGQSSSEQSTGDCELASGEAMDQCTQGQKPGNHSASMGAYKSALSLEDEYESLLREGNECYSAGKLKEALELFLRAIDIRSGDPELQLMTIQLYRQLSQL